MVTHRAARAARPPITYNAVGVVNLDEFNASCAGLGAGPACDGWDLPRLEISLATEGHKCQLCDNPNRHAFRIRRDIIESGARYNAALRLNQIAMKIRGRNNCLHKIPSRENAQICCIWWWR